MNSIKVVLLSALIVTTVTLTDAEKCGKAWQPCDTKDGYDNCCEVGYYCQPWRADIFQCQATPPKCQLYETNINFYGNDIKMIYGITPNECCDKCAATDGCLAFTFINDRAGPPACCLKTACTIRKQLDGAVSAYVKPTLFSVWCSK